jgi:hypothetical protein
MYLKAYSFYVRRRQDNSEIGTWTFAYRFVMRRLKKHRPICGYAKGLVERSITRNVITNKRISSSS